MADSSNTRLDARIEAAAKAVYEWDYFDPECITRAWERIDEGEQGWYRESVTVALTAADEISEPGVERLVAALRHASMIMTAARIPAQSTLPNTAAALRDEAHAIDDFLAEFGQQPTAEYRCPACGSRSCDCEGKHIPEGDRARWAAEQPTEAG